MIAKHFEHTDIDADQQYSKRHPEVSCSMATSDKYMPHRMCIQDLKYILNIINTHISMWCRSAEEEYR